MKLGLRKPAAMAVAVLSVSAWAAGACAEEIMQPPAMVPTRTAETIVTDHSIPNRPVLFTGAVLFLAGYAPSMVVASGSARDGDQYLYAPVAGPWIDLGVRGGCGPMPCRTEEAYKALLVGSGVAQAFGAVAMFASLFVPETRQRTTITTVARIVPARIGPGYGVAMFGSF